MTAYFTVDVIFDEDTETFDRRAFADAVMNAAEEFLANNDVDAKVDVSYTD